MAYDEGLAARIRAVLGRRKELVEKKMFGGLAFLLNANMFCGVLQKDLVLRLGAEAGDQALKSPHVRSMDFTGRPMKGYVYIAPPGIPNDQALRQWLERAIAFTSSLKKPKRK